MGFDIKVGIGVRVAMERKVALSYLTSFFYWLVGEQTGSFVHDWNPMASALELTGSTLSPLE
ncbi:MAG: hypothetical protein QG574_587 [Cyanobacteriota bacterium erpe_2018_sw_21hr_WHONDRS-SW48-000092_B_bin.40]|jgi:hypothetical protein|nr:hypothetical protein [Cyanobacteriota bacterium erpe_2018_sw_21hr_WHONDRS-SW48-000092_B_bin.40]